MDSHDPLSQQRETLTKKPYSTPELTDLGAIGQIALGGVGSVAEMAMMTAAMKHP
jgi:hypothetical protein